MVFNGDCIDDPASHDEATAFLSELNSTVGAADVPVFYLRGNHEIRNAYSIGLRELFDYVGNRTYGAFNWGDTRIVMLDCGEDKPDDHWVYYGLNDFSGLRAEQVDFLRGEVPPAGYSYITFRFTRWETPTIPAWSCGVRCSLTHPSTSASTPTPTGMHTTLPVLSVTTFRW